ncbi:MAG: Short-chain dehydrogenase [Myxococcaceae bacterium]|nr:Short-chain dehydrogenase [Myxococcaceae bacterium]
MMKKRDTLRGKVVVITGASSGVGRAAAVAFAQQGCRLALAARRSEDLEETARLCIAAGGEALVVVTDVTREQDVSALAQAALDAWQRIDIWLNNAGVTLFAVLEDAPFAEHRRVIETNLFGAMHGARAVVPIFKAQGQGVLINVGSVLSKIGQPFVPSYAISKFALRGLSESLRAELADLPEVHVCSILPYTIDTPHFQSGADQIGLQARALPPVQSPEKIARAIVKLAVRPQREVYVPHIAVLGLAVHSLFPDMTERLLLHALRKWHFDQNGQPVTTGNLYEPVEVGAGSTHGKRRPQLGLPGFLLWTARELVRLQLETVSRWLPGKKPWQSTAPLPGEV